MWVESPWFSVEFPCNRSLMICSCWMDERWRTRGGWLHTDQNGRSTGSDFACAQSLVSITESNESRPKSTRTKGTRLCFKITIYNYIYTYITIYIQITILYRFVVYNIPERPSLIKKLSSNQCTGLQCTVSW